MDRFLAELQSEGIRDSRGYFTVDARLARQKMAAHQLPDPAAYALKLVQAAVASSAPSLTITAGRDQLTMAFPCQGDELGDPAIVGGAVLRVASLPRSALRHLAVCLNAVCCIEASDVKWQTPRGTLCLTKDSLSQVDEISADLRLVVRKKRSLLQWFLGTPFVDELRSLSEQCAYAPLDLRIDGREVERPVWSRFQREVDDQLGLPRQCLLLEGIVPGRGVRLSFPDREVYRRTSSSRQVWNGPGFSAGSGNTDAQGKPLDPDDKTLVALLLDGWDGKTPFLDAQAVVGLPATGKGFGEWRAVIDGVALKPVGSDGVGHPGALALFDAGDLATDFSEFRLVRDERFEQKLAWVREQVVSVAESASREDLESAIQATGVDPARLERVVERAHELLHNHGGAEPRTVEELAFSSLAGKTGVYLRPNIPADKLHNVLALHAECFAPNESVLALYDDTVFGSAKDGFVITERRLCWKAALMPPRFLLWEELPWLDVKLEPAKVVLRHNAIGTPSNRQAADALFEFLERVEAVSPPPLIAIDEADNRVVVAALKTLGKGRNVAYHPYIGRPWLAEIQSTYKSVWLEGDVPLVCYDDTIMGDPDNGWVVTRERVYWRGVAIEPTCQPWNGLASHDVGPHTRGVRIREQEIPMHLTELRQSTVDFFQSLARGAD